MKICNDNLRNRDMSLQLLFLDKWVINNNFFVLVFVLINVGMCKYQ